MSEDTEKCPFRFAWGTFCRDILTNEKGERTLYNIMSALEVQAHFVKPASFLVQQQPFYLPLGDMRAYILLERILDIQTDSAHLAFDVISPDGALRRNETFFAVGPKHTQIHQDLNLNGLMIPITPEEATKTFTFEVRVTSGETEIGRIKLPVTAKLQVIENVSS